MCIAIAIDAFQKQNNVLRNEKISSETKNECWTAMEEQSFYMAVNAGKIPHRRGDMKCSSRKECWQYPEWGM